MAERVVDASLAIKWVKAGEAHRRQALRFLQDALANNIQLIAPPLFESEVESIIQEEVFLGYVTVAEADRALRALGLARVHVIHDARVKERARRLARQFNQRRVYDATYAALAQLRGCDFWTADRAFYDAVKSRLVFVKYLPNYL